MITIENESQVQVQLNSNFAYLMILCAFLFEWNSRIVFGSLKQLASFFMAEGILIEEVRGIHIPDPICMLS